MTAPAAAPAEVDVLARAIARLAGLEEHATSSEVAELAEVLRQDLAAGGYELRPTGRPCAPIESASVAVEWAVEQTLPGGREVFVLGVGRPGERAARKAARDAGPEYRTAVLVREWWAVTEWVAAPPS